MPNGYQAAIPIPASHGSKPRGVQCQNGNTGGAETPLTQMQIVSAVIEGFTKAQHKKENKISLKDLEEQVPLFWGNIESADGQYSVTPESFFIAIEDVTKDPKKQLVILLKKVRGIVRTLVDNYRALGLPSNYHDIKLHILKSIQFNYTQAELWHSIANARRQPRETLLNFANRLLTLGTQVLRITGKTQEYVNPHLIMAFKTAIPPILHNFINPNPSPDESAFFITYFQRAIAIVAANPQFMLRNIDVQFEKGPRNFVENQNQFTSFDLALPPGKNSESSQNRCFICNKMGHRQFECRQNPNNYSRSDYVRRSTMENMLNFGNKGQNSSRMNRNFTISANQNSPYQQNSNPRFPRPQFGTQNQTSQYGRNFQNTGRNFQNPGRNFQNQFRPSFQQNYRPPTGNNFRGNRPQAGNYINLARNVIQNQNPDEQRQRTYFRDRNPAGTSNQNWTQDQTARMNQQ